MIPLVVHGYDARICKHTSRNSLSSVIILFMLMCRSSLPDYSHAETPGLSDNHVQRQNSLRRRSQGTEESPMGSHPVPSHQDATPGASQGEHSAPLSRGSEILDCLMSGMRLALQWHLQHRYPDVCVQVCAMLHCALSDELLVMGLPCCAEATGVWHTR